MTEFPALEQACGELNASRKALKDVFAEAGPDLDMNKVKSISGDKIAWIRAQNSEIEERAKKVEDLKSLYDIAGVNRGEYLENGAVQDAPSGEQMTLGAAFTKSIAFKRKGETAMLTNVNLKTDFTRTAGWDPEETRSGKVLLDAQRPAPHVVNFIPSSPINQSAYKYMEETTFTNAAAETAEGGTFPEAALALTERTQTVEKVAVWIPVTDEQLEDVQGAEAYVNQRLTFMIQQRLDLQVLQGDGTTPNLLGTENKSGILTQAKGADSLMDATYKLFTSIRETAFAEPSVCFLRPSKWQEVVLAKTADGQYIWAHPAGVGPTTLWGVPVVPTLAATSTKLVTGDYTTHASLFLKRGIEMQTTNAHSDYFIKGKQAIRADMRAVMVHFRPEAFGTVTGL